VGDGDGEGEGEGESVGVAVNVGDADGAMVAVGPHALTTTSARRNVLIELP
jgi:hypothetical protein